MADSRLQKSLMNAKVNTVFYFLALFLSFFSRKIFLDKLGADFVGFTGTVLNLFDFLNLAELGIGSAVGVVLYKPLFDKDQTKINEIISVFGYFYKVIGLIILGCGVTLSLFLPLIFSDTGFPLTLIYFTYYSFFTSVLIGYFANYKQTLLGADQRNYVIVALFQTVNICKVIVQIILVYYTGNYYLWVAVDLTFGIIYSLVLNRRIKQVYPWLASNKANGKALSKKYPLIMTYAKQLFVHKIGTLVQLQIKPLLIYAFVSLSTVAYYGNYSLIIDKLGQLITNVLGSTGAGVGNLIAEGDKHKIKSIFWELMSLRFFIAGVLVFSVYYLINPFISLWVGSEYILSNVVIIIILTNMFIAQTRGTVDQFIHGYGLFYDVWAPITESVMSLLISLVAGYFYGLPGVLIGSVVSLFFIVVLWKPYFLFTKGFKDSLLEYWFEMFKYLLFIFISWLSSSFIIGKIPILPAANYLMWIVYSGIVVIVFSGIYFVFMFLFSTGFKKVVYRFSGKLLRKFQH